MTKLTSSRSGKTKKAAPKRTTQKATGPSFNAKAGARAQQGGKVNPRPSSGPAAQAGKPFQDGMKKTQGKLRKMSPNVPKGM